MVCGECEGYSKKLRRHLKTAVDDAGARKRVRVVECGCLDICPKRAAVVATAGDGPTRCTIVRDVRAGPRALSPIVARFIIEKG